MKGETVLINGDNWTVVDVAPAPELAEMVAVILEEAGFVTMTRGPNIMGDVLTHLGTHSLDTTYVLVPRQDAERALALIEATVTDYEGDELDAVMADIAEQGWRREEAGDDEEDAGGNKQ